MAVGRVKEVEIRPSRQVGLVEVVSPYSRSVLKSADTVANVSTWLQQQYGWTKAKADQLIQRGREVRGITVSIGDAVWSDNTPLSS